MGEIFLLGGTSFHYFFIFIFFIVANIGNIGKLYICTIPSLEYEFACHQYIGKFCITRSAAEHLLPLFIYVIGFYEFAVLAVKLYYKITEKLCIII